MKSLVNNTKLVIDTSNNYCILGLVNKNNQLIDKSIVKTNNNLTELVTSLLHDLLVKNDIEYKDLGTIYTIVGPGSFTGVKVGVSITKTICSVYKEIDVYWMDSASIVANFNGLGCIDAKSKLFYVIGYQNNKNELPLQFMDLEQLKNVKNNFESIHFLNEISIEQYCDNLFKNLDKFIYLFDYHLLLPAYVKPALYNSQTNKKV